MARLFFSTEGAHSWYDFSATTPAKAASRQSVCPAGASLAVSSIESERQAALLESSSSTSSSASTALWPQSRSGAMRLPEEVVNTASSSVGASSSEPKASGWSALSMFTGAGREKAGTPRSISGSGAGGGGGGTFGKGGGPAFATGTGGGGTALSPAPMITPARVSADFTMEISGSGGTKGFFKTPSAPTRCASCSSKGSKAPTSKITGMWARAESCFT